MVFSVCQSKSIEDRRDFRQSQHLPPATNHSQNAGRWTELVREELYSQLPAVCRTWFKGLRIHGSCPCGRRSGPKGRDKTTGGGRGLLQLAALPSRRARPGPRSSARCLSAAAWRNEKRVSAPPKTETQLARFVDIVRQRFLAVHVLAQADGHGRRDRVLVVRRAHHDSIDVLLLVQHHPKIVILGDPGVAIEHPGSAALVHIAKGNDSLSGYAADVPRPTPAGADNADAEPLIRSPCLRCRSAARPESGAGHETTSARQGG